MPAFPRVMLPHLQAISLMNTIKTYITLLEHITPSDVCHLSLNMEVGVDDLPLSSRDLKMVKDILSSYSQCHFPSNSTTKYDIILDKDRLFFNEFGVSNQ
jgi:hypothetical protein